MQVRIYRPAKSAMQSGHANSRKWIVEHEPAAPKEIDPLMGWVGTCDTRAQVKLRFDSKEQAVGYAKRKGLAFRVFDDNTRTIKAKNYADNFKFDRVF